MPISSGLASAVIAGASLASTSIQEIAGAIGTNRNCTIEITNFCEESLTEPKWYCESGYSKDPLPPHVRPQQREAASFTKVADTACGSVFVFSYKIDHNTRFAVLVSVPYDQCSYQNWFGAKFISTTAPTDSHLYNQMYYNCENNRESKLYKSKDGKTLTIENGNYKVAVTMSDSTKAVVKLSVYKDDGRNNELRKRALETFDWIPCEYGDLPTGAFEGGYENGRKLFVIRAHFSGSLTPGKLIEGHKSALIPWDTRERQVSEYEVLVSQPGYFKWVSSEEGHRHSQTVVGGSSENGEDLLVGRAYYEGGYHPGKVHPSHGTCYISYGGKEISVRDYQILVH